MYAVILNHHTAADCVDGEMRLVEGSSEIEGRVEVWFGQRWGTVSSDGWTQTNTEMVCSDLGYETATGKIEIISIIFGLIKLL